MSKNYSFEYEVAIEISKNWSEFAIDIIFELMSFQYNRNVDMFSLAFDHSYSMTFSRVNGKTNVVIVRNREVYINENRDRRGRIRHGRPEYDIVTEDVFNCQLNQLYKKIDGSNGSTLINASVKILDYYRELKEFKDSRVILAKKTKDISRRMISKELIIEK